MTILLPLSVASRFAIAEKRDLSGAFAVTFAVYCVNAHSGAHLNPAVTIGLAAIGKFEPALVPTYLAAQMIGASDLWIMGRELLPNVIGPVKGGQVRALAVASPRRLTALPDVPTAAELGIGKLTITPWAGFFGPAGLPPEITEKLSQGLREAMARADVREALCGYASDQKFVSATLALAQTFEIKLSEDEVREALSAGQREWLERWL